MDRFSESQGGANSDLLISSQREPTRHGDRFFPLARYTLSFSKDFPLLPLHWHEEAELTLIQSGSCVYHIDLCEYPVREGDIVLLPPAVLHSAGSFPKYRMQSESFVFHLNFLGIQSADICSMKYLLPFSSRDLRFPYVIPSDHAANPKLREIICRMSDLYLQQQDGYELLLKSLFFEIFSLLLPYRLTDAKDADGSFSKSQSDKLKSVLDYIEMHYPEPLSVRDLAAICCFSEYHFMRFFKLHVGMTCTEYINTLRLEKAWQMLNKDRTPVLETALSCGFHNLSYFYRLFRKKYHMTPKEVLRQ